MAEANPTDAIEFDRSVIGVDVEVGTHLVAKEDIIAYAEAVGETNSLYLDEEAARAGPYGVIIAPPLFYNMLNLRAGLDPKVKFGTSGFDAGQSTRSSMSPYAPATPSPPGPRWPMSTPRRAAPGPWYSPYGAPPTPTRRGRRR